MQCRKTHRSGYKSNDSPLRGETIKHRNECGERSLGLGLVSWLVVTSVPDCEGGGKGKSLSGEERV
jgi:hypothetical protein